MAEHKKRLLTDETYVGIFNIDNTYQVHILSPVVISSLEKIHDKVELVYFRCFSEILLALGYKEILRELSVSSLKMLITKENPEQGDLKMKYYQEKK